MTSSTKENSTIIDQKPAPIIFGEKSLSDVTLVVGNQDFVAHKLILACRSDVFKAMFFGEFKESKEERVEIKDVSVDNFRRLLEFIYIGKPSDSSKSLEFPHPTFRNEVSVRDFGKSVLYYFWNDATEILNIADRFNMTPMVKDYFEPLITISMFSCAETNCHACFNYFIFAIVNGIDVSISKKRFLRSIYWQWVDYASEEPFPDISKKAIKILSKHLQ